MEKLLIVDDEEIELDGMAELIDWPSYGYELVGTAINGKRGLALIQEKQPDIVITDIKMPVMDGLAMIRAAQEQHVDTVFVVLSGYGDYEYTSQAMQLGIRHYILKPCDEAKILPVLEQARAELHERRSKAQKTTEMENTVRRMAPMAREKALRDLLLADDALAIRDIMRRDPVFARAQWPRSRASELIGRYDLLALPVINGGEKMVGIVTVDDAMDIEKQEDATQLARFTDRQNNPEKQWKITDEDWRNREKWEQYEEAVNEMIIKTSTSYAPWTIVEGNCKYYARIKVLETVVNEIEKRLKKTD